MARWQGTALAGQAGVRNGLVAFGWQAIAPQPPLHALSHFRPAVGYVAQVNQAVDAGPKGAAFQYLLQGPEGTVKVAKGIGFYANYYEQKVDCG